MNNYLSKSKSNFAVFLLLVLFLEKLFVFQHSTGHNNKYFLFFFSVFGMILLLIDLKTLNSIKKFVQSNFVLLSLFLLLSFYIVSKGINIYSYTHILTFFIIVVWSKVKVKNLHFLFYGLIIAGFIFSLLDRFVFGLPRSFGFLINSATLFSLMIISSSTYILFGKKLIYKYDYFILFLAFISIVLSKTRSSLVLFFAIVGLKLLHSENLKKTINVLKVKLKDKKFKVLSYLLLISTIIVLVFVFKSIFFRSGGHESTTDRANVLYASIKEILDTPQLILFGRNPGSSVSFVLTLAKNYSIHFMHQDILMFVFEYGIIGLILILILLYKIRIKNLVIVLSIFASFHNSVFYIPMILILVLLNNALKENNNEN